MTRKKYEYSLGSGLLLLLLVLLGSSLVLVLLDYYSYGNVKFVPTFYLVLVYLIWFLPFLKVKMDYGLVNKNNSMEEVFAFFIIILVLPSTFFYLGKVVGVFAGNADSMLEVRHIVNMTEIDDNRSFTINNYFIAGAQFYVIALYLYFMSLAKGWKKVVSILLLFSSFSFPLYCLSRLGRDGVVYWTINTLLLYSLFKNYLQERTRKKLFTGITVFGSVLVVLLVIISSVRFSSSFIGGTVGYIGQSVPNFSTVFGSPVDYSLTMFPGVYSLLGIKYTNYAVLMIKNGYYDLTNSFSTFVPNLFLSYGYVGGVFVSLLVLAILMRIRKNTYKNNSNFEMMIMLVIMQVPMNGVFYYRQGIGNGDVYLILSIALLILFPKIYRLFFKSK